MYLWGNNNKLHNLLELNRYPYRSFRQRQKLPLLRGGDHLRSPTDEGTINFYDLDLFLIASLAIIVLVICSQHEIVEGRRE